MIARSRWEWLDFDEDESKQVRNFLSLQVEGEGVDPLRIGASVRDLIAERLFPGTSTQYERLRYVILVAAVLRKRGATLDGIAQSVTALNAAFVRANSGERGVMGRRNRDRDFVRLHWTPVTTWQLLKCADPRDLTLENGLAALQPHVATDEDGNTFSEPRARWDPKVVQLADEFWAGQRKPGWPSIRCSQGEVDYILERWLELPRKPALAALALQIRKGSTPSEARYPWDVSIAGFPDAREDLDRAKTISLVCWSAQLAYNFALLEQAKKLDRSGAQTTWKRKQQSLDKTLGRLETLRDAWNRALKLESASLAEWGVARHWEPCGDPQSREFLAATARKLLANKTNLMSAEWTDWVKVREKQANPAPKLAHAHYLATWSGTPEMANRWDFRWGACVRSFVRDAENPRG